MREDFLKSLKEVDNFTYTENGAGALKSTGNRVLDAFGTLGAMKDSDESQILNTFYGAFFENKELAIKLLFYIRDVRGGQGMRRVFRVILRSLANSYPEYVKNNMDNILFYGRGDDYLVLFGTACEQAMVNEIEATLEEDIKSVANGGSCSLLAKWLPSENTSSSVTKNYARKMMAALKMSPARYRRMLSTLRKEIGVVESKMSANKWDEIEFEKLPSKAAMIYSDAFMRHVQDNYLQYLKDLANGDAKVNAGALFPVDIVSKVINGGGFGYGWGGGKSGLSIKDRLLLDAMWKALPNYFGDTEETGICVVDTSGSMSGTPVEVAVSLGIYCADKAKGPFKNHFIAFDDDSRIVEIIGDDIVDKVLCVGKTGWGSTNIEAVFRNILTAAVKDNLPQSDMPSKIYIISDMQFNCATTRHNGTFMDGIKKEYQKYGYTLPAIVYWNVRASQCGMFQSTFDGIDCCMVSGYSPSLFKSVIDGTEVEIVKTADGRVIEQQKIDPVTVMLTTLNNERYDRVWVG